MPGVLLFQVVEKRNILFNSFAKETRNMRYFEFFRGKKRGKCLNSKRRFSLFPLFLGDFLAFLARPLSQKKKKKEYSTQNNTCALPNCALFDVINNTKKNIYV